MEIQGKIKLIGETQTFGSNGFRKREIVITTEEQYPQTILIEFVQDRTELLDKFQIGDNAKINVNLRGREWTNEAGETKYFNSIQGWRIEKLESSEAIQNAVDKIDNAFEPETNAQSNEDIDDLAF